jgi:hypothetical protein
VIIVSPERGINVTREQMEAHLALHGWSPAAVGQGAAVKDEEIVYAFDFLDNGANTGRVLIGHCTISGLNLNLPAKWGVAGATKLDTKRLDDWLFSDKYFWPIAHKCVALDSKGLT